MPEIIPNCDYVLHDVSGIVIQCELRLGRELRNDESLLGGLLMH